MAALWRPIARQRATCCDARPCRRARPDVECLVLEGVRGRLLDGVQQLGAGRVVGPAELVVTGLDDGGELVAELQCVRGRSSLSARRIVAAAAAHSCARARSVLWPAPMMVRSVKRPLPVMVNVQVFMAASSPAVAMGGRGRTLGCR